ncbi:class I SAM-dependent methyltransferase [Asaia prunellae]|uniref:class I SAM-dependent methyltransferase n=1 Tax=Asaia prunellae TaxID=610245 RepID=UPI00046E61D7|nr:class I SAM-dependent methyltransferase [Asaia prunellae]
MISMTSSPDPALSALSGVPETMLITLAARLLAPDHTPELPFHDPSAANVAAGLGFDPARFVADRKSMRGTILRAMWFDRAIESWFDRYPASMCLSFGSGLDMRQNRLRNAGAALWYDIELPEILALRERVRPAGMIGASLVSDASGPESWLRRLPHVAGQPVLFFAEGVLMYLKSDFVWNLLEKVSAFAIARKAPVSIIFDYVSPFVVRHSHMNASVRQTGARFEWCLRTPQEVTDRMKGLELCEQSDLARHVTFGASCVSRLYRLLSGGSFLCGAVRLEGLP